MTNEEIREQIKENDKIIENVLHNQFILNPQVQAAIEENKKLRAQCTHDFSEGSTCKYCGLFKEEV